ncbi:hypothetical protein ACQ86G_21445 [Roseateles chitinivorans]
MGSIANALRRSRDHARRSVNLALLSLAINAATLVLIFWGPR